MAPVLKTGEGMCPHAGSNPARVAYIPFPNSLNGRYTGMNDKIMPIGDRIVVQGQTEEEKTQSGLILSSEPKENPNMGKVIAVSPEVHELEVGQTVVYSKHVGTQVKLSGEQYLILRLGDILGVVE